MFIVVVLGINLFIVHCFWPIQNDGHHVKRNNVDPLSDLGANARTGSTELTVDQFLDVGSSLGYNVENDHSMVVCWLGSINVNIYELRMEEAEETFLSLKEHKINIYNTRKIQRKTNNYEYPKNKGSYRTWIDTIKINLALSYFKILHIAFNIKTSIKTITFVNVSRNGKNTPWTFQKRPPVKDSKRCQLIDGESFGHI